MDRRSPTSEQIKALFDEYKISYPRVAKLGGVGTATVERWANGRTRMPYLSYLGLKALLIEEKI